MSSQCEPSSRHQVGSQGGSQNIRRFTKSTFRSLSKFGGGYRSKKSYWLWPTILLAMMVLLAIIAALQYRWTAEVTGVDEFRVGRELESVMIRWHLDLYGEFSAVCSCAASRARLWGA